jgi:23S rRNA pseudouridine1911/1915/1917 synthase
VIIDETIPAALAGERLDRLVALVSGASRADAAVLVAAGGASVDGDVCLTGKLRLTEGQHLVVDLDRLPQPLTPQPDPSVLIDVVYEDAHILVIDKAAGLVVHPGAGNPDKTLVNGLLARFPDIEHVGQAGRPGIVHRLDVGTSGLLVVARTDEAYHVLVAALSARDVGRRYRAFVWGIPANAHGVIDAPIGRDHRDPMRMAVVIDGKSARTHYRTLHRYSSVGPVSELECRLETGRTHQIRVHLTAIGHPVVGDLTYGGVKVAVSAPRPMLHAAALAFRHPITDEEMSFESEVPDDLRAVVATLGPADEPA